MLSQQNNSLAPPGIYYRLNKNNLGGWQHTDYSKRLYFFLFLSDGPEETYECLPDELEQM